MITAKTWTHPTTGQVRVYFNNALYQGGCKIWAEQWKDSDDFIVKKYAAYAMCSKIAEDDVEQWLKERNLRTWSDLMAFFETAAA